MSTLNTDPVRAKETYQRGHEIATHTINHVAYPNVTEIVGARDWLNKVGVRVHYLQGGGWHTAAIAAAASSDSCNSRGYYYLDMRAPLSTPTLRPVTPPHLQPSRRPPASRWRTCRASAPPSWSLMPSSAACWRTTASGAAPGGLRGSQGHFAASYAPG